jgi:threonine/homoserine/homoserine lactone efflux protein
MTHDLFLALAAFAFVSSITPGPNNLMLMASGATFGLRRTLPHMLGVALGFGLMVFLVGLGLAGLIATIPAAGLGLKLVSVAYLLYLAWRIATAVPAEPGTRPDGRPFSFWQAAGFQWVNPKAWTMALGAVALYAPDRSIAAVGLVAAVFTAINLPSVSVWAAAGSQMARLLRSPQALRRFNLAMALLLVASLAPIVLP